MPGMSVSLRNAWRLKRDTKDWPSNAPQTGFSRPFKASHWREKSEQWWTSVVMQGRDSCNGSWKHFTG